MTRQFFDQIDDELRGLLGPSRRDFQSIRTSHLIKVWYHRPEFHFEAQHVGARWTRPHRKGPGIEVGLHLEAPTAEANDELLASMSGWQSKLPDAFAGKALGPRASLWRRVSELVDVESMDDSDFAGEIAERLALYIKTLDPFIR
ncbi:MAG: hypothetical protein ABIS18_02575 [Actinomycetota bacterium]